MACIYCRGKQTKKDCSWAISGQCLSPSSGTHGIQLPFLCTMASIGAATRIDSLKCHAETSLGRREKDSHISSKKQQRPTSELTILYHHITNTLGPNSAT